MVSIVLQFYESIQKLDTSGILHELGNQLISKLKRKTICFFLPCTAEFAFNNSSEMGKKTQKFFKIYWVGGTGSFPASGTAASWKESYRIDW